jgi:tripartite-type tricarboxylate transporter receptor subunit TctC
MTRPEIREKLESIGIVPLVNTPAEFGALIKKEAAYWAEMIKNTGIKPIE